MQVEMWRSTNSKKYNDHLNDAIQSENILQQLADLYENRIQELTTKQQTELKHIDKKLTEVSKQQNNIAEK